MVLGGGATAFDPSKGGRNGRPESHPRGGPRGDPALAVQRAREKDLHLTDCGQETREGGSNGPSPSRWGQGPGRARPQVTCRVCGHGNWVKKVAMPYVFKYLASELAGMNVKVALDLEPEDERF